MLIVVCLSCLFNVLLFGGLLQVIAETNDSATFRSLIIHLRIGFQDLDF